MGVRFDHPWHQRCTVAVHDDDIACVPLRRQRIHCRRVSDIDNSIAADHHVSAEPLGAGPVEDPDIREHIGPHWNLQHRSFTRPHRTTGMVPQGLVERYDELWPS